MPTYYNDNFVIKNLLNDINVNLGAAPFTFTSNDNIDIIALLTSIEALIGPSGGGDISGTGTANKLPKFTAVKTIADSQLSDDGTTILLGANVEIKPATKEVTINADVTGAKSGLKITTPYTAASKPLLELNNSNTNFFIKANGGNFEMWHAGQRFLQFLGTDYLQCFKEFQVYKIADQNGYRAFTLFNNGTFGTVAIGQTANARAGAILEITSTTQGVQFPRVTTAQKNAITVTAASGGLMVFDTDLKKMCQYSGTSWETITSI